MLYWTNHSIAPLITNDGVTIAKEIELEDAFENMGAQLIRREVASKTNGVAEMERQRQPFLLRQWFW